MLTQLSVTTSRNTSNATAAAAALLSYDLSVELSFRNPNGHLSVHYLDLTAVASYGG